MMEIPVYKNEADIAEQIRANVSIAYVSPAVKFEPTDQEAKIIASYFTQGNERDPDLYFVKSILVTSCWNKNDDVFDKAEMWKARHTPEDKPSNIGHDERKVVGHITSCWGITDDGDIIPNSAAIDDLPDLYHLVNTSVIYKHWSDADLKERVVELIEQIEAGTKFVSMECLLSGFDYAIQTDDNQYKVQARDENSSFLTKYLKAYGGPGEYRGMRVGRLLRNLSFVGKGFVDQPANPDSIIFHKDDVDVFKRVANESVYNSDTVTTNSNGNYTLWVTTNTPTTVAKENDFTEENLLMTDTQVYDTRIKELETKLEAVSTENDQLKEQIAKSNIEGFEKQIEQLTDRVRALTEDFDQKAAAVADLEGKLSKSNTELSEAQENAKALQEELDTMKKQQLLASRVARLAESGMETEEAEQFVAEFAELSDTQFEKIAVTLIEAAKKSKKKKMEEEEKDKTGCAEETDEDETNADENVLDEAESDEGDPALAANIDEVDENIQTVRAGLVDFVKNRLGRSDTE